MNSRIVMPSTKEKLKIKKFFSRNTPPGLFFYLSEYTKSIVRFLGERNAGKASTPGKYIEPSTAGEPLASHNCGF
jgi:hypothetical protein